ncbi:MAG: peptidylprolyl isomerase [Candidatus Thiodiazotropha sp.]
MHFLPMIKRGLLLLALFMTPPCFAIAESQVLATIGDLKVTSDELESAMASFPFADSFPSMDENDQAALRGSMLQRLVASRLMTLEAKRLGLDKSPLFLEEIENFRLGLLYRHYMDKLRERVAVPEDVMRDMQAQFKNDSDGLAAARSAYLADSYRNLRYYTIQKLRSDYHIQLHEERIKPGNNQADSVLLEGDGIRITYGMLTKHQAQSPTNPEWIKQQLYKRAELLTVAKAADQAGVDVSDKLESFAKERLPALLMEQKQQQWTADENALREFFAANPKIGRLEERRHIGQLVSPSREQAESLRQRILNGESLFELASQYSIDPYGREHKGDMGWQLEGRSHPAIEQAISRLEDKQISEVIETPMGFHLVTILERRPGGQKSYSSIRDRVQQLWITEQMARYMSDLAEQYQVVWHVVGNANKN